MRNLSARVAGTLALTALSACVGTDVERSMVGGLLGGLGASALGGSVAGGVLVGVAAGALADDVAGR